MSSTAGKVITVAAAIFAVVAPVLLSIYLAARALRRDEFFMLYKRSSIFKPVNGLEPRP